MSVGLGVGVVLDFLAGGGVGGGTGRREEWTGAGEGAGVVNATGLLWRSGEGMIVEGVLGSAVLE